MSHYINKKHHNASNVPVPISHAGLHAAWITWLKRVCLYASWFSVLLAFRMVANLCEVYPAICIRVLSMHLLSDCLPSGLQPLTPWTPRGIEVANNCRDCQRLPAGMRLCSTYTLTRPSQLCRLCSLSSLLTAHYANAALVYNDDFKEAA